MNPTRVKENIGCVVTDAHDTLRSVTPVNAHQCECIDLTKVPISGRFEVNGVIYEYEAFCNALTAKKQAQMAANMGTPPSEKEVKKGD